MEYFNAMEAKEVLGLRPIKFLRLLDKGFLVPEIREGVAVFSYESLMAAVKYKNLPNLKTIEFPKELYFTPSEAMEWLDISRRTFYNRVNAKTIRLYKKGKLSYVKKSELFADDDLF